MFGLTKARFDEVTHNTMQLTSNIHIWEGIMSIQPVVVAGKNAIFIDTGLEKDRQTLCDFIQGNGFHVAGVICTHAHRDHSDNVAFLRQTFSCPVASPEIEAKTAYSYETLTGNYTTMTPDECRQIVPSACYQTDVIIPQDADQFSFCGVNFGVLPLNGHTRGQIGLVLPGNIAYVSDTVLSISEIDNMKLPSITDLHKDYLSKLYLRQSTFSKYILTHKEILDDIVPIIDYNIRVITDIGTNILSTLHNGDTAESWMMRFCNAANIHPRRPLSIAMTKRNFLCFVRYMHQEGFVKAEQDQAGCITYTNTGRDFVLK